LVYLNPIWKPGDGGEIELLPFLEPPVLLCLPHCHSERDGRPQSTNWGRTDLLPSR
jgi:hypothetical protein